MSLLFSPLTLPSPRGGLTLPNRIVVAPMCQYQAQDGATSDWHLMHWGNLFNSGAALFTIEATAVLPEGRISPGCLGLWDERTTRAMGETLQRARKLAPALAVCVRLFSTFNMTIIKVSSSVFAYSRVRLPRVIN